jgi:type VI secretion system secreted protein Hcp
MATDMFLKLGDIKGESRDLVHRDEIDITEWNWGMSQSGSMHSGTGGGAGKDGGAVKYGWNIRENIKV